MKAIVTGGAGFIGCHLVDSLLELGHDVVVIDNLSTGRLENLERVMDDICFVKADLAVRGEWESHLLDADLIFHLAALADIVPSIVDPESYLNANVLGTQNVLLAAKESRRLQKFIYAASSSCYGIPDVYPTPESSLTAPQYPYALSKRMGEELVMHWREIYNLPAISLRFFNVYGPRSRTSGTYGAVFGVFLAQKLAGKPFTVVGDGRQTRDFTYVTDVVDALTTVSSAVKGDHAIYNIGSGTTVSVNRLVELLEGESTYIPKRPGEPDCTFADISRIKADFGWTPKIPIDEGVRLVLDNISYWQSAPVWSPEGIKHATVDWFKYLGGENG